MKHSPNDQLFLYEEILLLALKDEEGTLAFGVMLGQALGGAILAELLLQERVEATSDKKPVIRAVTRKPLGDPILDDALELIRSSKKPLDAGSCVGRFAALKDLYHRAARQLVRRGVLKADEDKILWIFKRRIYPERDPKIEREILERLEHAIFKASADLDARTTVLVGLAHATGLLSANFDKKELKKHKQRIEKIAQGELVGRATQQAVEAVQTAIMVASIMPAMTATVIASTSN